MTYLCLFNTPPFFKILAESGIVVSVEVLISDICQGFTNLNKRPETRRDHFLRMAESLEFGP
ncbi:MAG: hypothetical protein M2R45_00985 [Verrucomicrobia subdivision 3 bacterium]|nr:hypothetical protein [Limisphaerales bacterium]MCS1414652.1 hypothetical protein [Limisphaerales bacterium]